MTILARNWKCRAGELDIVALDENELVFAEVKTLRAKSGFDPAVNLSHRQRRRNFTAADISPDALELAAGNAESYKVKNLSFIRSDLFSALNGCRFELIGANLPYVTEDEYPDLPAEVRDLNQNSP